MSTLKIDDIKRLMANPFYAINIDEALTLEHDPLVSKKDWVEVQKRLILEDEDGVGLTAVEDITASLEKWLILLLEILEGDYITE